MNLPPVSVGLPAIVLSNPAKNSGNDSKNPSISDALKSMEPLKNGKTGISSVASSLKATPSRGKSKGKSSTKSASSKASKGKEGKSNIKGKAKGKNKKDSDELSDEDSFTEEEEDTENDDENEILSEEEKVQLPSINSNENTERGEIEGGETLEDLEKKFKNTLVDPEASYFYTFVDGSAIRYLIDYLTLIAEEGTFIFKPDEIVYQKGDEDGSILNDVRIKPHKLIDREYKSTNPEILSTISFAQLKNKTRTVGKKEQMDIYRRSGEPSNFYIQVRSQEKNSDPVLYRMTSKSEAVELIELPTYKRDRRNPNCTIFQADFNKTCKALHTNKCAYAEFVGYEKGLIIKGYDSKGGIVMIKEFGKCKSNDVSKSSTTKGISIDSNNVIRPQVAAPKLKVTNTDELEKVRVSAKIYKALIKVNGFTGPNTTLNFYIEKDAPMKIVAPIGTFGKLTILIR